MAAEPSRVAGIAVALRESLREQVGLICSDCGNLLLSREMFADLRQMIRKNPAMQQADYFHDYIRETYIAHAVMMVRKHVKVHKNSVSLAGVAQRLIVDAAELVVEEVKAEIAERLDAFRSSARKVEAFGDKVVAHRDRRSPEVWPTYGDVDRAIDNMDALAVACARAVGGDDQQTCKPEVQIGWLKIFRDMGIET